MVGRQRQKEAGEGLKRCRDSKVGGRGKYERMEGWNGCGGKRAGCRERMQEWKGGSYRKNAEAE